MSDDGKEFRLQVESETRRRLDRITSTPGEILRWDTDNDGEISAKEWEVLRTVVEAEVVRELSGEAPNLPEDTQEDIAAFEPVLEVIDDRYEVVREIGRGAQAKMFLARTRDDGSYVALKELIFANVESWKSVELFEREASALRMLNHESIPSFVDSFHIDVPGGGQRFFLAQEFVAGESLRVLIARGERFTEPDLFRLARELLAVLAYIHTLHPPVVHRDIKPSNIIRRKDGRFVLVDFGGVQLVTRDGLGGSTVVGTTGYMPPEQLIGRAVPQSDLYAVGATLVHLLTHTPPADLPQQRLKLVWRDRAVVHDDLADLIDKCLEPVVEDRPQTAREARAMLRPAGLETPNLPARRVGTDVERSVEQSIDLLRKRVGGTRLLWKGSTLVVDLSPRLKMGEWLGLVSAFLTGVLLFTLSMHALAFFMFAGAATFAVMSLTGSSERLEVAPDKTFAWFVDDQENAKGRLHSAAPTAKGLVVFTADDETHYVGKSCAEAERATVALALCELTGNSAATEMSNLIDAH